MQRGVQREVVEALKVIDETLLDILRTRVRWAVYELPYAYTIVLTIVVTLYLYRTPIQAHEWIASLLPAHVTWGKVLCMFTLVLLLSGWR